MQAESIIPRLVGNEVIGMLSPDHKTGNVGIDSRPRISSEKLDKDAMIASRPCGERIESGQLFKDLPLLLSREVSAPHFVEIARATCIHH